MRQVVQGGDDVPAVHLALIDLLRAVVKPGGITKPDRIRGGEKPEIRVGANDAALIEQRQLAFHFQHALDDEHHIRAAGIIFVEHQSAGVLQSPGQNAFAEFRDLLAILQHDRVLADQVNTADVAIQIDANARPVQPCRHLFDMG